MVNRIAVLMEVLIKIPRLSAEYQMDKFRKVLRNTVLDLSGQLSLTADKKDIFYDLSGSCNYLSISESRNGIVCKRIICMNSSTKLGTASIVSSATMTSAILDATSQIGESSMVYSMMNLDAYKVRLRVFRRVLNLFTVSQ